jgi:hypothetical protein
LNDKYKKQRTAKRLQRVKEILKEQTGKLNPFSRLSKQRRPNKGRKKKKKKSLFLVKQYACYENKQ